MNDERKPLSDATAPEAVRPAKSDGDRPDLEINLEAAQKALVDLGVQHKALRAEVERLRAESRKWKVIAVGAGAHLEMLEAHCAVKTGKTGSAHADEGKELREAGKAHIAIVRAALEQKPL